MTRGRLAIYLLAALLAGVLLFALVGYRNATSQPLVRHLTLRVPGYRGGAPLRIVLFSDLHVHGPDMPPARVDRIVDQINALHPDLDIAAGDFVGDNWIGARYPVQEAVAPLSRLKARLGVYAVLGNNDYDVGAADVVRALNRAGVQVLVNRAIHVGPISLGGIDGRILHGLGAWNARRTGVFDEMSQYPGVQVLVAHRPDEFNWTPQAVALVLAGHTHCGQIVLPLIGPLETGSDFGQKYLCGVIRQGSKTLVVTAGVGTSHVPLRIGAPADIWV